MADCNHLERGLTMPRVTYRLREPNGRLFTVAGTGLTRAAAVAEANTKLALTAGEVVGGSVSDILAAGETGTANAGASYSDADLTLKRTSTGQLVNVHLENISNDYGDGTTGDIDITNADIIAFATAYRDGAGNGGYEPYKGHFSA